MQSTDLTAATARSRGGALRPLQAFLASVIGMSLTVLPVLFAGESVIAHPDIIGFAINAPLNLITGVHLSLMICGSLLWLSGQRRQAGTMMFAGGLGGVVTLFMAYKWIAGSR